jgi:tape measure domain-containing protein
MSNTLGELNVVIGADISRFGAAANSVQTDLGKVGDAAERASGRYIDAAGRMREANGRFVSAATLAAEAAGNVGGSFAGVGAKAQGLASIINGPLASSFAAFDKRVDELDKGIGRVGEGLKSAGTGLIAGVTLPVLGIGAAAVVSAGDLQALDKGFAATYKGGEELSVALAKVQELAKLPGLGLKEAEQGAINLQAAGFSADLARRSLGAFGNALATVGKGKADLDGVGLALGQIASKGKISAEEVNQLAERVPQIRQAIESAFGTSDTEKLQKLNIDATTFVEGITTQLEKLPKVTGGINNAFENIQDAGTIAFSKLGNALNKTFNIEDKLGRLADFITSLADRFEALDPATQKLVFGLTAAAAAAGPLLYALGAILSAIPSVVAGFEVLGVTSVAALGPIGIAAAAVAAGAYLIIENWGRVAPIFQSLANTVAGVFDSIKNSFGGLSFSSTALSEALSGVGKLLTDQLVLPLRLVAGGFDVAVGGLRIYLGLMQGDFKAVTTGGAQALDGLKLALLNIPKSTPLTGSFAAAFTPIEEVVGLIGGDLAAALGKSTKLTEDQQKALDKLRKELRDNELASIAFGNSLTKTGEKYDFLGNKSKILQKGIANLTEVGFGPGGAIIQGFRGQLDRVPEAVDRAVERVAKGLEKLNQTPEFALQLPDKLDAPQLPQRLDANQSLGQLISQDVLKKQGEAVEVARQNYQKLTDAQKAAYLRTLDFNANMESAFDSLSSSIGPLLGDFAIQFGEAFGNIVTGAASGNEALGALFSGILGSIAGFMSQFGAQLVAIGIGKDVLEKLFTAPGTGPIAVAAGLGLIALGGVAAALSKNASSSLGRVTGGGGGSSYGSSGPSASRGQNTFRVEVTGVLKAAGQDLRAVLGVTDYRRARTS